MKGSAGMETGHGLASLPAHDADGATLAVIEACQGSRNKLKYMPQLRVFQLHHVLPLGTSFPFDFGFVPSTLGDDGDPLDVLVLMDEPVPVGSVVVCRLVGVIEATQRRAGQASQRNDRLIAVATQTHRHRECRSLGDLPGNVIDEIERFFVFYNAQRNVEFRPLGRGDAGKAQRLVKQGLELAQSRGEGDRS